MISEGFIKNCFGGSEVGTGAGGGMSNDGFLKRTAGFSVMIGYGTGKGIIFTSS